MARSRFRSVRARTALATFMASAVCVIVGFSIVSNMARDRLTADLDRELLDAIASVRRTIVAGEVPHLDHDREDSTFLQVVLGGSVLAASTEVAGLGPLNVAAPPPGIERRVIVGGIRTGPPTRLISVQIVHPRLGPLLVHAGASMRTVEDVSRLISSAALVFGPLGLSFVVAVAWYVTRQALRPVDTLRAEAQLMAGDAASGARLPVPNTGDEIARLATTLNDLLVRLEQQLQRQRRIVSDVSHELRSPLAALRTQLEVCLAHPHATSWQAHVEGALVEEHRLEELMDRLLLLARLDAGTGTGRRDVVDVAALATDLAAQAHDPRVRVERKADAPLVTGDAVQLGAALRNLIGNALRFARSQVIIRIRQLDQHLEVAVIDDGPGIAPADRERVFERFVRLDDSRARDPMDLEPAGFGLGLAITRDVVAAHGGTVEIVDPQPGHPGAVFLVRLPRSRATMPDTPQPAQLVRT